MCARHQDLSCNIDDQGFSFISCHPPRNLLYGLSAQSSRFSVLKDAQEAKGRRPVNQTLSLVSTAITSAQRLVQSGLQLFESDADDSSLVHWQTDRLPDRQTDGPVHAGKPDETWCALYRPLTRHGGGTPPNGSNISSRTKLLHFFAFALRILNQNRQGLQRPIFRKPKAPGCLRNPFWAISMWMLDVNASWNLFFWGQYLMFCIK